MAAHYLNGGLYPHGGTGELAKHIIPTIEASGGRVLVRKGVRSQPRSQLSKLAYVQCRGFPFSSTMIFVRSIGVCERCNLIAFPQGDLAEIGVSSRLFG